MSVDVEVVRVFATDDGALGNELGIVLSSNESRGREQEIAAELGFSETVFIDSVEESVATIRIFTPASEMRFAGHPSVGTAWWLRESGTAVQLLAEKAGDVAVRYDGDLTWITGRAEWASNFTWLPLETPEQVDALDSGAFTDGHNYAYAWIDEDAGALRSRMFAPVIGIVEDEATGAAAVAVTTLLGRDLSITQGSGSRILTRQLADGFVEVGGRTIFDRHITL